jgi:hypothetical protein
MKRKDVVPKDAGQAKFIIPKADEIISKPDGRDLHGNAAY